MIIKKQPTRRNGDNRPNKMAVDTIPILWGYRKERIVVTINDIK